MRILTCEQVSDGLPDKICDQIDDFRRLIDDLIPVPEEALHFFGGGASFLRLELEKRTMM